ncbi:hypothetical protein [Brevundimonas sp. Root1279]|uniref:hypothetical protein n=1 Tax=Brevundimonas sp. Root1279 TaxID=1736443 RepID=UPI0006FF4C12|nr:hypothetical protein [Brevundimonas sp. Root1279]KQW78444.1 hypothetical protein ASC65_16485 [Brevundimonas sp. Root1279]
MVGYLLLALTAALSVAAYRLWSRIFDASFAKREERAVEYADAFNPDILFVIDAFPRRIRRVLHPLALWLIALLPGTVHFLFVYLAVSGLETSDADLPVAYPATLALWLAALGLPAAAGASNRTAVRVKAMTEGAEPSPR